MALKQELMASGLSAAAASKIGYDTPATNVAAAGTTQSTATPLISNFSIVASGAGGVLLTELRAPTIVVNNSGAAVNVFPPVGCSINALAVNTAFSLTNGKQAQFTPAGVLFAGIMSA
jgi:hypothetical protein